MTLLPFFLRAIPRMFGSKAARPVARQLDDMTSFVVGKPPPAMLDVPPRLTMAPIAGADNPVLARGIMPTFPGMTHGPFDVATGMGMVSGKIRTAPLSIDDLAAIVAEESARKRNNMLRAMAFASPLPLGFMVGGDEA